jgi:hypothetical protein
VNPAWGQDDEFLWQVKDFFVTILEKATSVDIPHPSPAIFLDFVVNPRRRG